MCGSSKCKSAIIAPSALACDFGKLTEECKRIVEDGADWVHMDVMDGHFVPNISFGAPVIACVHKALPDLKMDCHMMVADPLKWIDDIAAAGGWQYNFHYEATNDHFAVIRKIKEKGMRAAMTLNPSTPSTVVTDELAKELDMVLIMTVWPGYGGQKFMPENLPKVAELRKRFPELDIEVDGGVGPKNIDQCAEAGANVAVAGTAVFGAENPKEVISTIRAAIDREQAKLAGKVSA